SRFGLEDTLHGKRDSHKRRLGIFGQRQSIGWTLEDDGTELAAQCVVDLLENRLRRAKICCEGLAHPNRLAALSRKYERDRHDCLYSICRRKSRRKTPHGRFCQVETAAIRQKQKASPCSEAFCCGAPS